MDLLVGRTKSSGRYRRLEIGADAVHDHEGRAKGVVAYWRRNVALGRMLDTGLSYLSRPDYTGSITQVWVKQKVNIVTIVTMLK